jgi:hypothetical protein
MAAVAAMLSTGQKPKTVKKQLLVRVKIAKASTEPDIHNVIAIATIFVMTCGSPFY